MSQNSAIQQSQSGSGRLPTYGKNNRFSVLLFILLVILGIAFAGVNLFNDVSDAGGVITSYVPFLLLGLALLIALGFEFVNGFHDTANAVATVIYTHSMTPNVAVMWVLTLPVSILLSASLYWLFTHF